MTQIQGNSTANGGRLDGSLQKTALSATTHVAIGAGWGGTATKALLAGSNDQRGQLTITASATTPAQATATVVITFADGAFASAPFCIPHVTSDSALDEGHLVWSTTTTALTLTYSVLPVATKIYKISWILVA